MFLVIIPFHHTDFEHVRYEGFLLDTVTVFDAEADHWNSQNWLAQVEETQ